MSEIFVSLERLIEITRWQEVVPAKCGDTNEIFSSALDNDWKHLEYDIDRYFNKDSVIHTYYKDASGYVKDHVVGREIRIIREPTNFTQILYQIETSLQKNGHVTISLTNSRRVDHAFELCKTENNDFYIADSYVGVHPPRVYSVNYEEILNLIEFPTLSEWNRLFCCFEKEKDWMGEENSKYEFWIEIQYVDH